MRGGPATGRRQSRHGRTGSSGWRLARGAETRTTGSSRGGGPPADGRSWPTIRTCRWNSRACGTTPPRGRRAERCRCLDSRHAVRRARPQRGDRVGHDQLPALTSRTCHRADRRRRGERYIFAGGWQPAKVTAIDIPVRGRAAAGSSTSGKHAAWRDLRGRGLRLGGAAAWLHARRRERSGERRAFALKWEHQRRHRVARSKRLNRAGGLVRRSRRDRSASRRRRRTSSTPTSKATSATRCAGVCRSGRAAMA